MTGGIPWFLGMSWGDVPHSEPARGQAAGATAVGSFLLVGFFLFVLPGSSTEAATAVTLTLCVLTVAAFLAVLPRILAIQRVQVTRDGLAVDFWLDSLDVPWSEVDVPNSKVSGVLIAIPVWPNAARRRRVLFLNSQTARELILSPFSSRVRPPPDVLARIGSPE